MQIKFIVTLIPYLLLVILKLKQTIYTLEQQKYDFKGKYIKWIKENSQKVVFDYSLIFIIILFGFLIKNKLIVMAIFIICCMIISLLLLHDINKKQNTYNKIYDKNYKIIFTISIIMYLLPILLMIILFEEQLLTVYYLILGLLIYINYFYIGCANFVIKKVYKK